MKHSAPFKWKYHISLKTNLLTLMTNLLMISQNLHFSNHLKNLHMHHNSPKIYLPWPSKTTQLFIFKHGGMKSFLTSANIYQQTRSVRNKNIPKQKIKTYITLSYHQKSILNFLQKNKNMKHYQEHSEFILSKMKLFPPLKHQNHMSNSLHTLITTMVLTFLLLLSLPWFLN